MDELNTKRPSGNAKEPTPATARCGPTVRATAGLGTCRLRAALRALITALLLCASPAFAQIAYVQQTGLFDNASALSVTSNAFTKNPVVGDTIVVMAWTWNASGYPTISVSDSSGNTYTQVSQPTATGAGGTGYQNAALFYAPVTKTGANFTVTVKSAQSASQIDAIAAEFSGVGALDQFNGINGTTATATISTPAATAVAGELVVSTLGIYLPSDQYTTISASAGYTALATELDNLNNSAGGGAYTIAASAGVQSITWSSTGGTFSNWLGVIATFKPSSGGGGGTPGAFAAYETATTPATAYTGNINTKVSGASYSLDVAALNATKTAVNTSFSGSVLVQVIGTTTSTPTLDANGCPSTSPQTLASPGTVNITNGRSTITFPAEPNAWRYAKVKVSYPAASPTIISCSGDMYAIKPSTLSVVGNDAACSAPGCYLNNATSSGTPIQSAGAAFTLTTTAYNAAATPAITTNYPGAGMSLTAASLTAIAPATVNGTLTPGSFSGSGGTATSSTATYTEVGDFTVQLQDTGFATVDSTESANPAPGITSPVTPATCSGYYSCSGTTTFGRFVPAQFAITPAAPVAACNGFTYFGESFSTPFTLIAQNASSATTQNYAGALAKLALTTWSNFVFSASGNPSGTTLSSGTTAPTGTWVAGSASISASQLISVPASPAGPSSVTILAQPVDSDGVTIASATAVSSTAATLYEGRARMVNAIGPETTDLLVPFLVEYWQSSSAGWQINTSDTCTDTSIQISAGTLAATATCVRDTGNPGNSGAGCSGASPIANHKYLQGGVSGTDSNGVAGFAGNFNLWLAGPGAGNLGYVTVTATVPTWLQYNWTGSVGNPSAVATFGMPKSTPILYRSEVYF